MVLFDTNVLCLLLHPDADIPNDPASGKPIEQPQERVNYLPDRLQDAGVRIVIPAPVSSEFLTMAAPDDMLQITQSMWFEVAPFDQRAAVESALALKRSLKSAKGKKLGSTSSWQKIKVDRQIVAIAKVYGVTTVYSTDPDVLNLARESGIEAIHAADLPLPPVAEVHLTLEDMVNQSSSSPPSDSPLDSPPANPKPSRTEE